MNRLEACVLGLLTLGLSSSCSSQSKELPTTVPRIKFYRHPMNPSIHSDSPSKDNMGMDYIPVYEETASSPRSKSEVKGRVGLTLSPVQESLSGVKPIRVVEKAVEFEIQAPGRIVSSNRASFQVYEEDLGQIRTGQGFTATSPALPGTLLKGQITSIESILDPMTRTARINGVLIGSPGSSLRIESSMTGTITIHRGPGILIPEEAVLHTGTQDLVYVTDGNGSYHPQPVKLGSLFRGYFEIQEGLSAGALISGGPNFLLDSESRIRASYDPQDH